VLVVISALPRRSDSEINVFACVSEAADALVSADAMDAAGRKQCEE
jgi:hypothetical protein